MNAGLMTEAVYNKQPPSAKVSLLSFIKMANTRGWGSYKIRRAEDRVASKVIMDASIGDKVEL